MLFTDRIYAVRDLMRTHGWDAVVIPESQVAWISGFTGEGEMVITQDHAGLWTDSRYFIQAARELAGTVVELHKMRVTEQVSIPQWIRKHFAETYRDIVITVDGQTQSFSSVDAIREALLDGGREEGEDFHIVNSPDWIDAIRQDRPAAPHGPVMLLDTAYTGWTRAQKLSWLRGQLDQKGCDAILINALDEIAWMLNVRGSDVPWVPVVHSYLIVTRDEVLWYVRKEGMPEDELDALQEEGIAILDYDDVGLALAGGLSDRGILSLWFDPDTLNYDLYEALMTHSLADGALAGRSPVALRKAVKNEVEIAGMKKAHLLDGLAMENFLYWLERSLAAGEDITEWEAAEKLAEIRRQVAGYQGDSFPTISAFGPSAALPHYVTQELNSVRLAPEGLYLVDSGGQYLSGTTDITRTLPLGPLTDLEREDYTLVLKGHIALARAIFPKGTAGCQIDVLARNPLWQCKRNFGHGTGHGVGSFLNVHEGPQSIRQDFNKQALLPGMVVSDEPGIYREDCHGVRHENLLLCVEDGTNDFGTWLRFETLTLCHFDTTALNYDLLTDDEIDWLNAYHERVFQTLSPHLGPEITAWLRDKTRSIFRSTSSPGGRGQ